MKSKIDEQKLLLTAYFWRWGIIILIFLLPTIFGCVFYNVKALKEYTPFAIYISIGVPMVAMGIDYILGCIFEFNHMILIDQDCKHQQMNPYNLSWNVSKKEFIGIGIIFLVLGIAFIILSFII